MKSQSYQTVDRFYSDAKRLREDFASRFKDPRSTRSDRFVWDYWHVPGQYTLLRTPALSFFNEKVYLPFHEALVQWGRRELGCHDVSPPWLSCYVDGCQQELHADVPHGPWAFVYSLTPWRSRKFSGGETLILKPETLRFWEKTGAQEDGTRGEVERKDLIDLIPAEFNRLTVFDPRFPHGVTPVKGVQDPREGRLVIHGWFVNPRPFFTGPRTQTKFFKEIERFSDQAIPAMGLPTCSGVCAIRLQVLGTGKISHVDIVRQNLRTRTGHGLSDRQLLQGLARFLQDYRFTRASGKTTLTLPWVLE